MTTSAVANRPEAGMGGLRKNEGNVGQAPIFLIGMPRSGTKLLRSLLNRHSRINLLTVETEFLPEWASNWRRFGDLADWKAFQRFHGSVTRYPYFQYMRKRGTVIDARTWYEGCRSFDVAGVFEALARHDAPAPYGTDILWGDKSPSYIRHVPLLMELFPRAKIIHIVRDVRDYCVSIRKAWGKSVLRAAQRWSQDIEKLWRDVEPFRVDFLEINYEALITDTEKVMREVCGFLALEFEPGMVQLDAPSENLGDTRGVSGIVRENAGKHWGRLSLQERNRIEGLAYSTLKRLGYPVTVSRPAPPLSNMVMKYYQVRDAMSLMRFDLKERGLVDAIRFRWWCFLVSGNRN